MKAHESLAQFAVALEFAIDHGTQVES